MAEITMRGTKKQIKDAAAMPVKGTFGELVKVVTVEAPLVPVAVGPPKVELLTGKPYPPPVLMEAIDE